jgi:hypothetical protein
MNGRNNGKIKNLLDNVPPGYLVDSAWMSKQSISKQSVHDYVRRGWLERMAHGVYRRPFTVNEAPGATNDWKIALLSAQWILGYDFHVGGTSALALQGLIHYLKFGGNETVMLYGADIPIWLFKLPVVGNFVKRSGALFGPEATSEVGPVNEFAADQAASPARWTLKASRPERAILEALYELPKTEGFDGIDKIFESLRTLRPDTLMLLLASCNNVRVKRLFFVFAARHNHPWFKYLNAAAVNLGTGDRAFVKGGKLHPVYRIMVPPEFLPVRAGAADGL